MRRIRLRLMPEEALSTAARAVAPHASCAEYTQWIEGLMKQALLARLNGAFVEHPELTGNPKAMQGW